MSFDHDRLTALYNKFVNDTATAGELRELWSLLNSTGRTEALREAVFGLYDDPLPRDIDEKDWSGALHRILDSRKQKVYRMRRRRKFWAVAASVAVLFGLGVFFAAVDRGISDKNVADASPRAKAAKSHDVAAPNTTYATITLADGSTLALDSAGNGLLAMQQHTTLSRTPDGIILYAADQGASRPGEMIYNTVTNPRGSRVVHLALSDGSLVWLNAGSSITFPVAFAGERRDVTISGEAFFEVAHMPSKMFVVHAGSVKTEVLGTHFNISSYSDDDDIRVTLVEGKVSVQPAGGAAAVLMPGQQAVAAHGLARVQTASDMDNIIAWKNDRFSFTDTNIRQIMKEVARWYDVDIEYQGSVEGLNFGGSMSRQRNVSELLTRLEATQAVKFRVDGKKISVLPVLQNQ